MSQSLRRRLGIAIAIGLLLVLRFAPRPAPLLQDPQRLHRVERVVDGDTLIVSGGQRVRLLGVDTPELARDGRPAEPWSDAAREFLDGAVGDREVSLGFDREPYDKYGRRLAYLYCQGRFVNEEIIRAGYSRAETRFAYHESKKLRFRQAEREAREQQRGIWSDTSASRTNR